MNTNYLKSFITFALGSVFAVGADGLADSTQKTTHQESTYSDAAETGQLYAEADVDRTYLVDVEDTIIRIDCDSVERIAKLVRIDTAKLCIDGYRLWTRMVPHRFSISDRTISFESIMVSEGDASTIVQYAKLYNKEQKIDTNNMTHLPFNSENSLAQSYYIPLADIEAIICNYPNAHGIRAHMAIGRINVQNPTETGTHVYLAPALDSLNDIIEGVPFVYDLTMPCPSTCPRTALFPN